MKAKEMLQAAIHDNDFEKRSADLASADIGDMEPMFEEDEEEIKKQLAASNARLLEKLGISVVDKGDRPTVHINFDQEQIKRPTMPDRRPLTTPIIKLDEDG